MFYGPNAPIMGKMHQHTSGCSNHRNHTTLKKLDQTFSNK